MTVAEWVCSCIDRAAQAVVDGERTLIQAVDWLRSQAGMDIELARQAIVIEARMKVYRE